MIVRILKIALQGINSIKDKHVIDLTHDVYTRQGIFAITGATGSGKTTILDAICLAIYGRTPRLDAISPSVNELMNRQSGECLAQVWLQINDKQYSFLFTQRRAKNSPTGKLQTAKREIYEVIDGKQILLENKMREVVALTHQLLQMDFHQFTRSVMLAQGGFAAFLHSDIHQRGELLEKITGSDIYAKIGMQVYQMYKQKSEEINQYKQKIGIIDLLSEDEYIHLKHKMDDISKQCHDLNKNIELWHDKLNQKKQYDKLLSEKELLNQKLNQYQHELDNFNDQLQLLTKASYVDEIKPIYTNYVDGQNEINNYDKKLANYLTKKDELTHDYIHQKSIADKDYILSKEAYDNLQKFLPLIEQAREIDKKIYKEKSNISINQDFLKNKNEQLLDKQKIMNDLSYQIDDYRGIQIDLTAQLNELFMINNQVMDDYHNQKFLTEPYQKWHQAINHIQDSLIGSLGIITLYKELSDCQKNIKIMTKHIHDKDVKIRDLKKTSDDYQQKIHDYTVNNGVTCDVSLHIQKLEEDKMIYMEKINHINQLKLAYVKLLNDKEEQKNSLKKIHHYKHILNDILHKKNTLYSQISNSKIQLKNAQDNYELIKDNNILHQYFLQLKKENPCPLCGSLHHPKKEQENNYSIHDLNDAKQELVKQEEMLNNLQLEYQNISQEYAILDERIHILSEQYKEQDILLQDRQYEMNQKLIALTNRDDLHNMDNIYHAVRGELDEINNKILLLNNLIKNMTDIKNQVDMILSDANKYEIKLVNLLANHHHLVHDINHKIHSINSNNNIDQLFSLLHDDLFLFKSIVEMDLVKLNRIMNDINIHNNYELLKTVNDFNDLKNSDRLYDKNMLDLIHEYFSHNDKIIDSIQQDYQILFDHILLLDDVQLIVNDIHLLFKKFNHIQIKLDNINKEIDNAKAQFNFENKLYKSLLDEINDLNEKIENSVHNIMTLNNQKEKLIHTLDTEQLLNQLHAHKQRQDDSYQKNKMQLDAIDRQIFDINSNIEHINHQLSILKFKTNKALQELQTKLTEFGFYSMDECLTYDMQQDERILIQNKHRDYLTNIGNIQGRIMQVKQDIGHIIAQIKDITDVDDAILRQHIDDYKQIFHQQQQQLFAIKHQIEQHEHKLKDKMALLKEQHALQQQFDLWDKLNHAIGSSDGKKYRNIVQAITLSHVLLLANEALATMNNRYILTNVKTDNNKTENDSLEISVIDTHQAHAVRTIKNLSGGETFLISLALALGLSKVHSHKMNIYSLFLDEGFGTLDDDALDVALNALGELRQAGKMIGVISHIDSLKQRVATHIEVVRISSGISKIKGYGVKHY